MVIVMRALSLFSLFLMAQQSASACGSHFVDGFLPIDDSGRH